MTRRWIALAAFVLVTVVLLGGCGTIRATNTTRRELNHDGFGNAGVSANETNGVTTVVVRLHNSSSPVTDREAAGIVWRTFDYRVDRIQIISTNGSAGFTRITLEHEFGPRPASFDERTIGSDAKRTVRTVGIIGAVVAVGFLVIVAVAVVLVVWYLHRRQQRPPPGPAPPFNPPVSGIGGTGWIPPQGGGGGGQWPPPPR